MAANKYIAHVAGVGLKQVSASQTSTANAIIAADASGKLDMSFLTYVASSAGAGDAGKIVVLDGSGKIDNTMIGTIALSKLTNSSVPSGTLLESNGTNWAIGRLITISVSSPSGGSDNDIWFKI